jgi:hypothetical protein
MGFGDLSLFAAGGCFGDRGCLGTAGGFDTLGGGCTSCLVGLAQSTLRGRIGLISLIMPSGRDCAAFSRICGVCGGFGFGLGEKGLLAYLLRGMMSQLRAVLAARGREIAIFGSMEIGPGVENGHIFRSLRDYEIIGFFSVLRVHNA